MEPNPICDCGKRMEWQGDWDKDGNLLNAWWECPSCNTQEQLSLPDYRKLEEEHG
jgi:hypothetical protein